MSARDGIVRVLSKPRCASWKCPLFATHDGLCHFHYFLTRFETDELMPEIDAYLTDPDDDID